MAKRNVEECSICMEEHNYLKILQCGHFFCVNCIEAMLSDDDDDDDSDEDNDDDDDDDDVVTCPLDRTVTIIPEGSAENLKTKFFTSLICESCCTDKSINESWWCETCGCTICGDCAMKKHRYHTCNEWNDFDIVKECYAFYKSQIVDDNIDFTEIRSSIDEFCDQLRDNLLNRIDERESIERAVKDMKTIFGIIENVDFKEGQVIKMKDKKFNAISKLLQTKPDIPELPQITTTGAQKSFYLPSIEKVLELFFSSECLLTSNEEEHATPACSSSSNVSNCIKETLGDDDDDEDDEGPSINYVAA